MDTKDGVEEFYTVEDIASYEKAGLVKVAGFIGGKIAAPVGVLKSGKIVYKGDILPIKTNGILIVSEYNIGAGFSLRLLEQNIQHSDLGVPSLLFSYDDTSKNNMVESVIVVSAERANLNNNDMYTLDYWNKGSAGCKVEFRRYYDNRIQGVEVANLFVYPTRNLYKRMNVIPFDITATSTDVYIMSNTQLSEIMPRNLMVGNSVKFKRFSLGEFFEGEYELAFARWMSDDIVEIPTTRGIYRFSKKAYQSIYGKGLKKEVLTDLARVSFLGGDVTRVLENGTVTHIAEKKGKFIVPDGATCLEDKCIDWVQKGVYELVIPTSVKKFGTNLTEMKYATHLIVNTQIKDVNLLAKLFVGLYSEGYYSSYTSYRISPECGDRSYALVGRLMAMSKLGILNKTGVIDFAADNFLAESVYHPDNASKQWQKMLTNEELVNTLELMKSYVFKNFEVFNKPMKWSPSALAKISTDTVYDTTEFIDSCGVCCGTTLGVYGMPMFVAYTIVNYLGESLEYRELRNEWNVYFENFKDMMDKFLDLIPRSWDFINRRNLDMNKIMIYYRELNRLIK